MFDVAVNRDSFVFNIWLDALRNFQRVDFRKLPFNILVQIHTPIYRPHGTRTAITQMDRFRDAAADTHMAYLGKFLEHTSRVQDVIPEIRKEMADSFDVDRPQSH